MKSAAAFVLLICIATPLVLAQRPADLQRPFDEAQRQIVRLPPTAFPELSRKVIRELQRRGCTIPQPPSASKLHNVISGAFAKPGQTDWAVLCSLKGVSTILVFWNASEKNPAEIAHNGRPRFFFRAWRPTRIAYSRAISADRQGLHHAALQCLRRRQMPPPIDHQGVDDAVS